MNRERISGWQSWRQISLSFDPPLDNDEKEKKKIESLKLANKQANSQATLYLAKNYQLELFLATFFRYTKYEIDERERLLALAHLIALKSTKQHNTSQPASSTLHHERYFNERGRKQLE